MAVEFYDLPLPDLAALPQFLMTVDQDKTFGDDRLGHPSAVAEMRHLQEIVQFDKFMVTQSEFFHVCPYYNGTQQAFGKRTCSTFAVPEIGRH